MTSASPRSRLAGRSWPVLKSSFNKAMVEQVVNNKSLQARSARSCSRGAYGPRSVGGGARHTPADTHIHGKLDMQVGKPVPSETSTWFEEVARDQPYDLFGAQITLSLRALRSSSHAIVLFMLNLAKQPGFVRASRKELIFILGRLGMD